MSNLKILIIDDEQKVGELLRLYIKRIFPDRFIKITVVDSVKTGVLSIEQEVPDLVFLDIEMPEENGFALFDKVDKSLFEVVFTTAYSQYMTQSINEFGCFGYLLKPYSEQDLRTIFNRYDQSKNFVFVNAVKNIRVSVRLEEILYCKAESNYCTIYLKDAKYLVSKTLGEVEKSLPEKIFYRVHRSYVVNVNHIDHLMRSGNKLVLKHQVQEPEGFIPVSAAHKKKFEKFFI